MAAACKMGMSSVLGVVYLPRRLPSVLHWMPCSSCPSSTAARHARAISPPPMPIGVTRERNRWSEDMLSYGSKDQGLRELGWSGIQTGVRCHGNWMTRCSCRAMVKPGLRVSRSPVVPALSECNAFQSSSCVVNLNGCSFHTEMKLLSLRDCK